MRRTCLMVCTIVVLSLSACSPMPDESPRVTVCRTGLIYSAEGDEQGDQVLANDRVVVGTPPAPLTRVGHGLQLYADLDLDGHVEVLAWAEACSGRRTEVVVLESQGWTSRATISVEPADILSVTVYEADLDGDTLPEVALGFGSVEGTGVAVFGSGGLQSGSDLRLEDSLARFSSGANSLVGATLASGDLDGDGLADLAIGAPGVAQAAGGVFLLSGDAIATGTLTSIEEAAGLIRASSTSLPIGSSVAVMGDVNGDGTDDLAVGSAGASRGEIRNAGLTYVLSSIALDGSTVSIDELNPGRIFGAAENSFCGRDLVGPGDIDGDGAAEIGVACDPSGAAAALFFSGASLGQGEERVSGEELARTSGLDVAAIGSFAVGDVDGDGFVDVVMGIPSLDDDRGAAVLTSGADLRGGGEAQAAVILRGTAADARAGSAVAILPDSEGDGLGSLLIGATGEGEILEAD